MKKEKKQEKVKPVKQKKQKTEKPIKLRNLERLKYARIFLYVFLGFCFIKGVFGILFADDVTVVRDQLNTQMSSLERETAQVLEVNAFAEQFAKTYFTYEHRGNSAYTNSLKKYCSPTLVSELNDGSILQNSATAIFAIAIETEKYADKQYDVLVAVDVLYTKYDTTISSGSEDTIPLDTTTQITNYIKIPVLVTENGLVIEDMPLITAPPAIGSFKRLEYMGKYANEQDNAAAKLFLDDFFNTLYSESQNKINYFLSSKADNSKFIETKSSLTYEQIEAVTLFTEEGSNDFIAIVSLRMKDPNGNRVKQRMNVTLEKLDKFYIKDINLRGYNLKGGVANDVTPQN